MPPRLSILSPAAFALICAASLLLGTATESAAQQLRTIEKLQELRTLSREEADRGYPVKIEGVLTYNDPAGWGMFMEADGDGVYIHTSHETLPGIDGTPYMKGDVVRVIGVSSAGGYAPMIVPEALHLLRRGDPPPPPLPVSPTDLATAALDSRWVETEGVIRAVTPQGDIPEGSEGEIELTLHQGETMVRLERLRLTREAALKLIDSRVRVRGVCASEWTEQAQLRRTKMFVQSMDDVSVIRRGAENPWALPAIPYEELRRYRGGQDWNHRVKITGAVTHHVPSRGIYLQSGGRSIHVRTNQADSFSLGDRVEAIGYAMLGNSKPYFSDAVVRKTSSGPPPDPQVRRVEAIEPVRDVGDLLQVRGRLLHSYRAGDRNHLVLQDGDRSFTAILENGGAPLPTSIQADCVLSITGICVARTWPTETQVTILARSAADIEILRAAPLLDAQQLRWGASGLAAVSIVLLGSGGILIRKNRLLRDAKHALAMSNSALEAKVEARTTELKLAKEQAEQASAAAQAASHAKSQFLATMSHEIRTPLNGVVGMTNLLLDSPLNSEQRDFAETARISGEALLGVINDILDFSKIEAGKLDFEVLDFDLQEVVETTVDLVAERAQSKGLELTFFVDDVVPRLLCGDSGRLRQILLNLLSNAVKFTERGEVYVEVSCDAETRLDAMLRFKVRDTGIGISPEERARLFQPFSQADSTTTRKYGGTGLGLVICQRLAERMHGTIEVESQPGVGTTFCLLARLEKQIGAPQDMAQQHERPETLVNKRVLIVDDNVTNRRVLHHQVLGWRMRNGGEVNTGEEALALLRSQAAAGDPYDLVLLDMNMPGLNGLETARSMADDPVLRRVKVVMLTSLGHRPKTALMSQSHISACLLKPVKPKQLLQTLLDVMNEERSSHVVATSTSVNRTRSGNAEHLRLLIAEDNIVNQKVAQAQLGRLGFKTDTAANGIEVLEALKRKEYDLVFMDCQMPEMDGFEATRRIRANEERTGAHRIQIVAMTANAMKGDREQCLEAGMDDYICKPVAVSELTRVLEPLTAARLEKSPVVPG
ncbi:MAG TPA: response regulator [Chthoniobacteraceae bacterium]|jgi:signal transduction histidine kinase/DNA-binding response OmpR family regulator